MLVMNAERFPLRYFFTGKGYAMAREAFKTNVTGVATSSSQKLSRDDIAKAAYYLWVKDGRKPGSDMKYWLEAEKQLAAQRRI